MSASGFSLDRLRMPNDDWKDWTLHISTTKDGATLTAALPLSEGRFDGASLWIWYGSDIEALRLAWTEGQPYSLRIVEDPRPERTPQVSGPPLYLKVTPQGNHRLTAWWKMPENRVDRAPPNTTYKVQWKEASGSWDTPTDVSEQIASPSPATEEILGHTIRGLTGGVEYDVRVIATNPAGDSVPSEVASGTPKPLPATSQSIVVNSPARGAPRIDGIPEVGQHLSVDTTGITEVDGLDDVVFTFRWLADDAEISGADDATYTPVSDDLGKVIRVRVDFIDDAGHEESVTSQPSPVVAVAAELELQSATVNGSTLRLTYSEMLDRAVTLPTSAFTVNVFDVIANRSSRSSIIALGVDQSSVLLFLSPAVVAGDAVTVDYTVPDGSHVIKDTRGRQASSFSRQLVRDNTASTRIGGLYDWLDSAVRDTASDPSGEVTATPAETTSPELSSASADGATASFSGQSTTNATQAANQMTATGHDAPAAHDGSTTFTFELRFSETPREGFSYKTLRDHAFTVTGGDVTKARRLERGENIRWEIHVTPGGDGPVTIVLPVSADCTAEGAICTQDGRPLSNRLEITIPGPGG